MKNRREFAKWLGLGGLGAVSLPSCSSLDESAGDFVSSSTVLVPSETRSHGFAGKSAAMREYREKFLASGASLRYAPRGGQGGTWTDHLESGYQAGKRDPRVAYAVKNLRTGRYLAESHADQLKYGGSMPKPAVSACLLEKRKGNLTREEFLHIVYACDKSVNASWKALLSRFNESDESYFESKYNLPNVGIRSNVQSPRFYAEFFERCVNYRLDYGCHLLIEAMRRSQYGKGRAYLPSSSQFVGGKTGTVNEWKHEGLFFDYRGGLYAIVVYTDGYFGRGENYWKMGALFGGLFREYVA